MPEQQQADDGGQGAAVEAGPREKLQQPESKPSRPRKNRAGCGRADREHERGAGSVAPGEQVDAAEAKTKQGPALRQRKSKQSGHGLPEAGTMHTVSMNWKAALISDTAGEARSIQANTNTNTSVA